MAALPWLWAAVAVAAALLAACWQLARSSASQHRCPDMHMAATTTNRSTLSQCPSLAAPYRSCWFLPSGGHVETILAWALRRPPRLRYYRRCLSLPDGGIVSLDFDDSPAAKALPDHAPVLLILPGLTGGSHDAYPLWAAVHGLRHGFRAVVFNARGTAGTPVATPRFYSASYTGDLRAVIAHLARQYPRAPLVAVGYSLGANILVKYLGEEGPRTPLVAAASLCNPFNLPLAADNMSRGFSHAYDLALGFELRRAWTLHRALFGGPTDVRWDLAAAARGRTIQHYDEALTTHIFGWSSVEEYYSGSSSADSVPSVAIPLLCIQAQDDPIAPAAAIPVKALEQNENCILAITSHGGHLGWMRPDSPLSGPWTDIPKFEFFDAVLARRRRLKLLAAAWLTRRLRRQRD